MRKRSSRCITLSLLLIGLVLAGLLPVAGIAQNDSEKKVIVSFDMPVTELTLPLGTNIEDIPLPETLTATLDGGTVQDIPVTWESDGYHQEAAGTYLFTADIGTWIYPQARPVAVVTVVHPDSHRHISGELWLDKNGDGIRDVGETGIAGYPVTLYAEDDFNTEVQTTLTKTDGAYRFEGMEPGSYVVKVSSDTIGGTEYLLPLTIGNDNKFAMDEEAAASWSVPLEIGEDTAVTGIDAGMRLPEGIKPFLEVTVDDFSSIQMLINYNQVHSGDTIIIADGANIVFTSSLTINKNLTFRASGSGTVTFTSKNQRHFIIPSGSNAELTFDNVILDGGGTGGGIEVKTGAAFTLRDANIQKCTADNGGAVYALNNSRVTIADSMISGNTATKGKGGGVCGISSQITISGSTISGNKAEGTTTAYGGGLYAENNSVVKIQNDSAVFKNTSRNYGGGLSIYNGGSLTVEGSNIYKNNANGDPQGGGGGIFVDDSVAVVRDGSMISENASAYCGGGVYVYAGVSGSSSLTVQGSTISENNGGSQGGGIMAYKEGSQIIVDNSTISANRASYNGGGLCTLEGSTVTIKGDSVVSDNRANRGGGMYANIKGVIKVNSNSNIMNNIASSYGGAIYAGGASKVTVDSSAISGNSSVISGGGIYFSDSSITVNSSMISDNKAAEYGGGIYSIGGTLTVSGDSNIVVNKADNSGGGVHLTSNAVFLMEEGEIIGNIASGGNGGGIFADSSTVTIKNGKISDNTAVKNGGGIYTNDLTKLSVLDTVKFSGNTAWTDAEPLPDMVTRHPQISAAESSVYDHPLNNFDINVLIVKVYYIDRGGSPIDGLNPVAYAAASGESFALPDERIPSVSGYVFMDWKEHLNGGWKGNTTVQLANVVGDTDIYLVYEMRNVTVSQKVIGSYADKTRDFLFTIYFLDGEGVPLAEGTQLQYTGGILSGSAAEAPAGGTLILGESGKATFILKHGQQITIMAVPQGSTRVIEDSDSNYRVSFVDSLGQETDGSDTGQASLDEINSRFDFINTRNEEVPTGVRTGSLQGPILLGVSMLLLMGITGVGTIHSRRKRGL
ncbi:right-handed parallel beta-helix repeat-containing protein [Lacrimispora sp.]|uniref:right-handed parallel beta-helix repeat-containing protein n=1 Tax=Lacrimispora sp. TaxID=2719234 RepID=UPI00289F1A58|nr:right-handed parallel beta-helix repeat-containing protein [Lacrimispora sp.]